MKLRKSSFLILIGAIVMTCLFAKSLVAAELVIIANRGVSETQLSKGDVKKIYSGKKTKWGNDETIVVTVLEKGNIHKAFLKQYVKKSPSQFKLTWKKMMFTGKGTPPQKFKDMKSLIKFVSKTPGAIGYITSNKQSDAVKILAQ